MYSKMEIRELRMRGRTYRREGRIGEEDGQERREGQERRQTAGTVMWGEADERIHIDEARQRESLSSPSNAKGQTEKCRKRRQYWMIVVYTV
jgi:hypothetical protein